MSASAFSCCSSKRRTVEFDLPEETTQSITDTSNISLQSLETSAVSSPSTVSPSIEFAELLFQTSLSSRFTCSSNDFDYGENGNDDNDADDEVSSERDVVSELVPKAPVPMSTSSVYGEPSVQNLTTESLSLASMSSSQSSQSPTVISSTDLSIAPSSASSTSALPSSNPIPISKPIEGAEQATLVCHFF